MNKIHSLTENDKKIFLIQSLFDIYDKTDSKEYKIFLGEFYQRAVNDILLFKNIYEEMRKREIQWELKNQDKLNIVKFYIDEDFHSLKEMIDYLNIKNIDYKLILYKILSITPHYMNKLTQFDYISFIIENLSEMDLYGYFFQYYQPPYIYTPMFINIVNDINLLKIFLEKKYKVMNEMDVNELTCTDFDKCQLHIQTIMNDIFPGIELNREKIVSTMTDHIFMKSMMEGKEENLQLLFEHCYSKHHIDIKTLIQFIYFTGGKSLSIEFWIWFLEKNQHEFDARLFIFWIRISDYESIQNLLDLGYGEAMNFVDWKEWIIPSSFLLWIKENDYERYWNDTILCVEKNWKERYFLMLERMVFDGCINSKVPTSYIGPLQKEELYQYLLKDCLHCKFPPYGGQHREFTFSEFCKKKKKIQILPEEMIMNHSCLCDFHQKQIQYFLLKGFSKKELFWRYPTYLSKGLFI